MHLCHTQTMAHSSSDEWVILIHGLFGDSDNLKNLAKTLNCFANVLLVDLPDHGQSPETESFDFVDYSKMITNTIIRAKIQNPHIVGHSLGGKMAMVMALNNMLNIRSLVIADIAPVAYPPRHDAVFNALNQIELDKIQNRTEVKSIFDQALQDEGTRQFLLKSLKQRDSKWDWAFNLTLLERDYVKLIEWPFGNLSSNVPTLFIKGGDSEYIQSSMQNAIRASFPKAKAHIIEGAGHWLHAQKPLVFNRVVARFLQSQT